VTEALKRSGAIEEPDTVAGGPRERDATDRSDPIACVWALLALPEDATGGRSGIGGVSVVACDLEHAGGSWRDLLHDEIERVPPGGALGVTGARVIPMALLEMLSHARWRRVAGPSRQRVEDALRRSGLDVIGRYRMWPTSRNPRVASSGARAAGWMQRSGVLGGGGNRMLMRAVARSRLVTPLVGFLAPRYGVVATRAAA
jgi:hypothetical protein